MITIDDLSLWMKENTLLSDSSIYKYSRAVNTISNEMKQKRIIPVGLFDMSVLQCDFYLPIILRDSDFVAKNSTGNNMYSNALKQYRMFRTATSDMVVDHSEVENAILGYEHLNETERTAIVKSRVGQGLFRKKLLDKYNGTCIVTGISVKRLLVASHIKPWAVSDNEERLSDENGLLLSPTYDKLFDYGLITFTDQGKILVSSQLSVEDRTRLHLSTEREYALKMTSKMKEHLDYHRDIVFVRK